MGTEKRYWYGNEVSDYGIEHGRVDYRCLAKAFDAVLNNDIINKVEGWEIESGSDVYYEDSEGNTYYSWSEMDDKRDELQEKIDALEDSKPEEPDYDEEDEESVKNYEAWEKKIELLDTEIELLDTEISNLEDEHYEEVFQWYIIDDNGADILKRETHEIVYYNEELDMYLWGITHWGTSWDYVLTEITLAS